MTKLTDITLRSVTTSTQRFAYRTPLKFGGRVVVDVMLLDVAVDVETRDGRLATGFGSMPMSNAWGWPSIQVSSDEALAAMVALGHQLGAFADCYREAGHPLEITRDLARQCQPLADAVTREAGLPESMPIHAYSFYMQVTWEVEWRLNTIHTMNTCPWYIHIQTLVRCFT